MSSAMYNKMWHQTQEALGSLLNKESQKVIEPQRNQAFIFQTLATFYIKYVQIFRNLENVYDQIVHPQKRILIRKILDGVMGRILELKNEMVELELTEFHYFDDILQDLKLAPQQLDIPIPKYFLKEKLEVIKGREKILAQILADTGLEISNMTRPVKGISLEESVKLIQVAERARQGCLRAMFMKQIFLREQRAKHARVLGDKITDVTTAALHIQKVWRGFHQCKKTERQREEEMVFLGMNPPPMFNEVSATITQATKVTCLRNEMQLKHEEHYREALVTIKGDLKLIEGPDIKENLQDQIRRWFIECRNLTGAFPDYPDVEEGGSAIIFSNKTPQQVIDDIIAHQEDEEKNKRKKKEKKAKKGKEKGKEKGKKGKKEKRQKAKDLTADRSIESLFKELVEEELLIQPLKVNLSDYIGEYSYLGTTLRQVAIEPMPSLMDVRQLIALYGILPLGSAAVHEKAPFVRSLLLAGPSGVGKNMLVHAICTETGANLFNLSSANIAGKYPGKSGLQMMLHMVLKMEPKRLKKQLPKILKLLKPNDRILIVGTTHRPFDAELQSFCRVYQKIILVPRPDYASRYVLWKQIIQRRGGVITNALNVSCLAKVTDGFTQGHIVEAIRGVLTDRRVRQQTRKPLVALEFVVALSSMSPVYLEEEDSFKDWYAKTPMGKKRNLALTEGSTGKERDKGEKKEKKGEKEKKKK
ncbi:PREDICTED: IQ and AAA domain-containing protein 1 [Hipposideros armiger]|uniref:IQ and AAA domain-containing protein 1 n=1 Tax=Hipposideros armiger TaxID=186990 RepID=A0A8B7Q5Z5_HIPAR|nr:PREDICTED: IQ and AAA domain-containing protein 1 [Hipposideros armiger]